MSEHAPAVGARGIVARAALRLDRAVRTRASKPRSWRPVSRGLLRLSRLIHGATASLLIIAALEGCKPAAPTNAPPPPVPVTTDRAIQEDVVRQLRAVGLVESIADVSLRPQVSGQVQTLHFREGQQVEEGAPIITLDPRPFDAAVRAAEAALARARALALDAEQARGQVTQARDDLAASQREVDTALARSEAAKAEVLAAEAALEMARLNRDYCEITAPFGGRVGAALVREGAIVRANETPLVDLAQIEPIDVAFSIPEQDAVRLKEGSDVRSLDVVVAVPGSTLAPVHGRLWFADNRVERGTGQLRLKARFDNRGQRLWPGQFVHVTVVEGSDDQVVTVPARAVQRSQQGAFVFVIDPERRAALRPVRVRRTIEGRSIIDEGLTAGDEVVIDGHLRLVPGALVVVRSSAEGASGPRP